MIVSWRTDGLDNKNIPSTYILGNLNRNLAIAERTNVSRPERGSQIGAYFLCKRTI